MSLLKDIQQLKSIKEVSQLTTSLAELTKGNVYMTDPLGNILYSSIDLNLTLKPEFKVRISFITETFMNIPVNESPLNEIDLVNIYITIVPIKNGGHLIVTKEQRLSENEIINIEYTAVLVTQLYTFEKQDLTSIIDNLSYSEIQAMNAIFKEMDGLECTLVASNIADKQGISRSIICNAIQKLGTVGIVNSRSLGINGTYIRINNPELIDVINKRCQSM
jgi:Pleiotropic transcriptional repressor